MIFVLMSPAFGPRYCGTIVATEPEKIWPTGALLKNGFTKSLMTGSS